MAFMYNTHFRTANVTNKIVSWYPWKKRASSAWNIDPGGNTRYVLRYEELCGLIRQLSRSCVPLLEHWNLIIHFSRDRCCQRNKIIHHSHLLFPVRRNLIIPLHITATPNQTDKVARKMGKCFSWSLQLFFSDTSPLIWFCLKAWSGENRVHGIRITVFYWNAQSESVLFPLRNIFKTQISNFNSYIII
jgi:hypothetical protein